MKKWNVWHIALILLPLAAVLLAGMPNSVAVYYSAGAQEGAMSCLPVNCSYFTLISEVPTGICLPFAAIFGCLTFAVTVFCLLAKKRHWLKAVAVLSFVAMTLAVLPIVVKSDEAMILPNVGVPILLGLDCLLAYMLMKQKDPENKASGSRLTKR